MPVASMTRILEISLTGFSILATGICLAPAGSPDEKRPRLSSSTAKAIAAEARPRSWRAYISAGSQLLSRVSMGWCFPGCPAFFCGRRMPAVLVQFHIGNRQQCRRAITKYGPGRVFDFRTPAPPSPEFPRMEGARSRRAGRQSDSKASPRTTREIAPVPARCPRLWFPAMPVRARIGQAGRSSQPSREPRLGLGIGGGRFGFCVFKNRRHRLFEGDLFRLTDFSMADFSLEDFNLARFGLAARIYGGSCFLGGCFFFDCGFQHGVGRKIPANVRTVRTCLFAQRGNG